MKQEKLFKPYETDASMLQGKATGVLIPETVQEVAQAVRVNSSITPRGSGTGLAGGCIPQDSYVIDMSKLNKIGEFDKTHKIIEVEAGIILDELNNFLAEYNLEFPINPSSHEVCTIGGMIATNAVGSRAIKYGRTLNSIEGLEIINSKGELKKLSKPEVSDFSGLEGITGIIVKARLKLVDKKQHTASLIEKSSLKEVLKEVDKLKREQDISMIEFLGKEVAKLIGLKSEYYLLIEYESNKGNLKGEKYKETLALRDKIYPLLAQQGYERIEDPKMFLDKIEELIYFLEDRKIPFYGHLGSGILHPCFNKAQEKYIPEMMKIVKRYRGQVSGEHGLGMLKKEFLDANDRKLFESVKKRNDPGNKFNPGKVL